MFYILHTIEIPFSATPPEMIVVASCATPEELTKLLQMHPDGIVVETLWRPGDGLPLVKKVPPELERGVEKWNEIALRTTPHLPRVKKVSNYVGAYRRWKRAATGRTQLLEDIVAVVERAAFAHPWVTFAWIFGSKGGLLNTDKLLDFAERKPFAATRRRAAANGDDFMAVER